MNKKKKIILILILTLILILSGLLVFFLKNKAQETIIKPPTSNQNEQSFLIDGFPIKDVPLYKLNKVSSNKIFVNTDPNNLSGFEEKNFAYFNVVFYSDAGQEEFLNYYKNLFDSEIIEEYMSPDVVKGNIGQYKVSAAHYGTNNTAYIQVHLPNYQDESLNQYFVDFPNDILATNTSLIEHEKSYGLLNQKGGEIEFTKYFTVINNNGDKIDKFLSITDEYQKKYQTKTGYSFDQTSGTMRWQDQEFEVTLAIAQDHGRVYLMLRKALNK